MSEVGLAPVPTGEVANFDGISDLQVTILAVYIGTSVLATIGLVLRLYTGAALTRNLGVDALLLIAAWAVYLASFIAMVKVMPCGFGKHLWSVTESGMQCYQNMLLFLGISYFWPPTLVKLSLVVLYHRINPGRAYRRVLYAIALACVVYTLVFTVILAEPCNPLRAGTTTCLNNIALAQAILNISTDAVLIIMPVVTLWGLQMPRKQKVAVGLILVMGSGATIASCVRIAYVRAMLNSTDVLYTQGSAAVWSAIEINLGILCNCLAMLKPFVRRHMPWLRSLIGARSGAGGSGREIVADRYHRPHPSGGIKKMVAPAAVNCRDAREGDGTYEMYSYGRDMRFDESVTKVEVGRGCDSGSGSASGSIESGQEHMAKQGGILVTTTVAMGRSMEGGHSTEDILAMGRSEGCRAFSAESRFESA